ncbi:Gag-Pol polyprotein [Vitis vinifera]|uniref:Gag-Pol polyprotein n=1 Tax=Vitis vinifera TaxID=29760 RepID=A0A438KR17_VITVI|nr:Gag-Pol polyprotein [Vitis vinifera]
MCGVSWLTQQLGRPCTSIVVSHMGHSLAGLENPGRILFGFNGSSTTSLGDIVLPVQAGPVTLNVQFSVVQELSPFNIILGRAWLHYMKAIPSTYHQMVSFLTNERQIDLYGSQLAARQCYQIAREAKANQEDASPPEPSMHMTNSNYWNHDIFAWAYSDMKGIHPSIASHRLNVFSTARPVRQKLSAFTRIDQKVIRNEIDKLLESGFIREVAYPDWLANVVVIKLWTPLPGKDALFLGCLLRISQIPMSPADKEKTAFINATGLYCYKVMPFGLKNAGATYQRLMTKIFKPLIGHTVEPKRDRGEPRSSQGSRGNTPSQEQEELQWLTGKLVTLGRFIARFTDELRPFFLAIRKAGAHGWTKSCQNTFEKIKYCLMQPLILSSPIPKEKLYMYLAYQNGQSAPFYSAALTQGAKTYLLRQQGIGRRRNQIFKNGANSLSPSKRCPRSSALISKLIRIFRRPSQHHESRKQEWWTLRVDGASRSSGSGIGLLLQSPTGEHLEQAIRLGFSASNNEAEYEAILSGLDLALALSVSKLRTYSDSQLVVRHVQKEYEAKDARMARYLAKVRNTLQQFTEWTIEKIKRADNRRTDALARTPLAIPSRQPKQATKSRRTILQNISGQALYPEIPNRHTKSVQATRFTLIGGHMYKRSFTGPYLRYLGHSEAQYVLAELHEGICGNHSGGRSLAHRAHSQGYYWPTMNKMRQPMSKSVISVKVGPLPAAPAQKKFLLVATDYFSKWVEAEAYASIKDKDVTKFVWKNIVCRFRIPQTIIADNGPQFDSIAFRNFCSELNIRNSYSTPRYPQSNGQVEATNKTLITALKKRLEQAKGKWVEELPDVLWAYRTTPGRPTGNTPFALTYGMDAVIPTEIATNHHS